MGFCCWSLSETLEISFMVVLGELLDFKSWLTFYKFSANEPFFIGLKIMFYRKENNISEKST